MADINARLRRKNTVVVAIDFGSTETKVIATILKWEDRHEDHRFIEQHSEQFKFPSVLRYNIHSKLVVEWGEGALGPLKCRAHSERCLGFKLFLCRKLVERDNCSGDRETPIWERQPICKNANEIVSDFLACVYNEIIREILHRSRRLNLPRHPQDWVFLVSHPQYFERSDIGRLQDAVNSSIISSHGHTCKLENRTEMAAKYILDELENHVLDGLTALPYRSSAILVCTAGGSSVEIVTYHVKKTTGQNIKLEKTNVKAIVHLQGSKSIDERFREHLRQSLPKNVAQEDFALSPLENHKLREFVALKDTFENSDFVDPFLLGELYDGPFRLERHRLLSFYDNCIHVTSLEINQCVRKCKQKGITVKRILLAGGLGSSHTFRNGIKSKLHDSSIAVNDLLYNGQWAVSQGMTDQFISHLNTCEKNSALVNYGLLLQNGDNAPRWFLKEGQSYSELKSNRLGLAISNRADQSYEIRIVRRRGNIETPAPHQDPRVIPWNINLAELRQATKHRHFSFSNLTGSEQFFFSAEHVPHTRQLKLFVTLEVNGVEKGRTQLIIDDKEIISQKLLSESLTRACRR